MSAPATRPGAGRWIGRPLRRLEDQRFLRGQARYIGDLALPGMLHLVVVRSPHGHAHLGAVETRRALAAPGVVAVLTGQTLAGRVRSLPVAAQEGTAVAREAAHPILATDRVRYVGQPVAAIVALSRAAAEDALDLLEIAYEPLPAVVDPHQALRGEVQLHDGIADNVLARWRRAAGDVEGAFARAAHVVRQAFHIPRLAGAPIEPRGALAAYDPGTDLLTLWISAQDPHRPRAQLGRVLDRPEDRIRVIVPDVGGGFGVKGGLPPEAAAAAVAAMDLGRPVRWLEDRRENLQATYQGRGLDAEVAVAADADGRVLAVRARIVADSGAYLFPPTANMPVTTATLLTGAYAVPAAEVEVLGVATNKVPLGPYRGAGRPEAALIVERMMDLLAHEIGLDPVEIRRRNFIPPEAFPHRTPLGLTYDSGNYAQALDRALEVLEHDRWREEQRRTRAEGRLLGIGLAIYVERAAPQFWESAEVSVDPGGRVVVRTGSAAHGQGHETVFAQIAAEALGLEPGQVAVRQGDSAAVPRGIGTFGSRSTTTGGSAVLLSARKIREKASVIAAHLLEAAAEDIEWSDGALHVRGIPSRTVPWTHVAAAAYDPTKLPAGLEPGLHAVTYFALQGPVFPYGVYAAVVEIDRETGEVRILRFVAVDDAGRLVNPLLAEGQVIGSTVQGLGQTLLEEVVYDQAGQLQTSTFADYAMPRATHVPAIISAFLETPSPLNPLGAKGIGESGTIGTLPAVANAVADALRPLGIRHVDVPFTPPRLWKLISGR
ncbi:MAG: xanthine dehydrogenase family protein molybdopterin-binding subunit [Armatimonadota bacterium]|nr:xanthine dehydrogenase family protein molybdopterin-binding subunit [Armatimonadota bacterium]